MFLSLLTGPFGKYIGMLMGIVLLAGAAFGYVKVKEHEAVQAALLKWNQAQLEETIKENNDYKLKIDQLIVIQQQLVEKQASLEVALDKKAEVAIDAVRTSKHGTKLDPIFSQTLASLKGLSPDQPIASAPVKHQVQNVVKHPTVKLIAVSQPLTSVVSKVKNTATHVVTVTKGKVKHHIPWTKHVKKHVASLSSAAHTQTQTHTASNTFNIGGFFGKILSAGPTEGHTGMNTYASLSPP